MNSKRKGSSFERYLCERLSLWISNGERGDLLWRSSNSGGTATNRFRRGSNATSQVGDICAVDPIGHAFTDVFYVEAKHYSNLSIDSFLLKGIGPIVKFWNTAKSEGENYKKTPMLICKQNRYPIFVILPYVTNLMTNKLNSTIIIKNKNINCIIILFEELLLTRFADCISDLYNR